MENKFEMGRVEEAWEHIIRYENQSAGPEYDYIRDRWEIRMKDLKGIIMMTRGNLEGAEEIARQCLETSTRKGYKKNIAKAERLLGQILGKREAHSLAESKLSAALSKLEEVGNPKQLWITRVALARLYESLKRPDLEREQWKAAASIIRTTTQEISDQDLRRTFSNSAMVKEIMEHTDR